MKKINRPKVKQQTSSARLFIWTLIMAAFITFGLPLLYEVYLAFTPNMDWHLESNSQKLATWIAKTFGLTILILGILVSIQRWFKERRTKQLKKQIRDHRLQQRKEKLDAINTPPNTP